jgi:hypothetical protein
VMAASGIPEKADLLHAAIIPARKGLRLCHHWLMCFCVVKFSLHRYFLLHD